MVLSHKNSTEQLIFTEPVKKDMLLIFYDTKRIFFRRNGNPLSICPHFYCHILLKLFQLVCRPLITGFLLDFNPADGGDTLFRNIVRILSNYMALISIKSDTDN
jgi:hypothetical protein